MKLSKQDIETVNLKTFGACWKCGCIHRHLDKHHIIWRSWGGSNHPDNLLLSCNALYGCSIHEKVHNSKDSIQIIQETFNYLPQDLSNCWDGKIKPKQVRALEYDRENNKKLKEKV